MACAPSTCPRSIRSPVLVVAELDVLGFAERLQRAVPALDLAVGDAGSDEVSDADDDQEDPEQAKWLLEHDDPFRVSNRFVIAFTNH